MALTPEQVIRRLRSLEKRWPPGYKLFSWSGSLCLLKDDAHLSGNDQILATFPGIPNDGGDPD